MNNGSLSSARIDLSGETLGTHSEKTNGLNEVKQDIGNEMKGDVRALGCSCTEAWLYCEAHCLRPKQT